MNYKKMATYYAKGVLSFNEDLNAKIKKDSIYSWWYQDDYERGIPFDTHFTGYVDENGKVFDISHILCKNAEKKIAEREKKIVEKFQSIQNAVLKSTEEVVDFCNKLDQKSNAKNKVKSVAKKIKRGWVQNTNKIGGSKRKRRFKKDNRRFLTDQEIKKLQEEKEYYSNLVTELSYSIDIEDFLYKIIYRMYDIKKDTIGKYHLSYGYHNTEGIYIIYELRLETLREKVNHLAYNDIIEEEKKKQKFSGTDSEAKRELEDSDSDSEEVEVSNVKRKDVKVFEEMYEKMKEKVEEDRQSAQDMTVLRERQVTNRARYYIDENGNRIELGSNVRQVVLHN